MWKYDYSLVAAGQSVNMADVKPFVTFIMSLLKVL